MDNTGSGLHPLVVFGSSCVEPSNYVPEISSFVTHL